ncbi:hypothetical protein [Gracilibacillus lacisalsi]|uniref:hypothetical protein n=1 Tax=Gracilibacillus lacisalsi TaxID=393087 RepID=UPI000370D0CD|nr:hypothetical protein [Gracilibacillus lacisalsi]
MNFEIRSVQTKYNEGEATSVRISYSAKNEDRSVSISGVYELTAEEFNQDGSFDTLEAKAQEHLLNEIGTE